VTKGNLRISRTRNKLWQTFVRQKPSENDETTRNAKGDF